MKSTASAKLACASDPGRATTCHSPWHRPFYHAWLRLRGTERCLPIPSIRPLQRRLSSTHAFGQEVASRGLPSPAFRLLGECIPLLPPQSRRRGRVLPHTPHQSMLVCPLYKRPPIAQSEHSKLAANRRNPTTPRCRQASRRRPCRRRPRRCQPPPQSSGFTQYRRSPSRMTSVDTTSPPSAVTSAANGGPNAASAMRRTSGTVAGSHTRRP